jgi:transposase
MPRCCGSGNGQWSNKARRPSGNGRLRPDQEELHRLRQENQRLRMERDILKKAALFFANEAS